MKINTESELNKALERRAEYVAMLADVPERPELDPFCDPWLRLELLSAEIDAYRARLSRPVNWNKVLFALLLVVSVTWAVFTAFLFFRW